jgi:hypothetical protein
MSNENKEYIEGIYNYCDRWCEKCRFTANCLLFTQESKIKTFEILHNGDLSGIDEVFDKEIDRMENEYFDDEEENENDLEEDFFNSINNENEDFTERKEESEKTKHPIEDLVDEYFIKSFSLIKSLSAKYKFVNDSKEDLEGPVAQKIFNDFEVFSWYHAFISAKIKRALGDLEDIENEDDDDMKEIHISDMNGSAKIGVISIKRSIDALNNLHESLDGFSSEVEELLVLLGKMLNFADDLFPNSMEFKRPGFDD